MPPPDSSKSRVPRRRPTPAARRRAQQPDPAAVAQTLLSNDDIHPARREDTLPVLLVSLFLAAIALIVCLSKNYLLLYGDAVAHLGIARRILDARYPGLAQLGGVWLPLSHLVMLPFIGRMEWWQNGMAGAWPSAIAYLLAVVGFFRLARRLLTPIWALAGTAFFALNPNLLYLSTTAMTEPLFLAITLWQVLLTTEAVTALARARNTAQLRPVRLRLVGLGVLNVLAVYTRYDGWILAALVWCVLAWSLLRHRQHARSLAASFAVCTVLTVAAPLGWFWYNHHFYGDWLDFMRGPYSASAIERKTSPPGSKHYRGWHNPAWALLFYTRTAQVDSTVWELGFLTLPLALIGAWRTLAFRQQSRSPSQSLTTPDRQSPASATLHQPTTDLQSTTYNLQSLEPAALLLWFPLPFYIYSIAWGSVPIFIPQLYPHSFYNARYGMELLPAIALFGAITLNWTQHRLQSVHPSAIRLLLARFLPPAAFAFAALNAIGMMAEPPLVLREGIVNSITRVAFEKQIAHVLESFPAGSRILISTNDHIGAVQRAGLPLKSILSDNDRDSFQYALADPGTRADYIVAIGNDPVAQAVHAHPSGITELTVLCTTGQPCARVYKRNGAPDPNPIPDELSAPQIVSPR